MDFSQWLATLQRATGDVYQAARAHLPQAVAAALILVLGWLAAKALRYAAVRLLRRMERLLPARARRDEDTDVERVAVRFVGGLVFWLVFLLAAGVAFEVLGLSTMTAVLARFANYLPALIAAVLVLAGGVLLGNLAASWVRSAARSLHIAYADSVGRAVKTAIILVASIVALTEAGIDSTLLIVAVATFLGAFLGAVGLAFGLGARTMVANMIASHYLQRMYRVDQRVRIGNYEGRILELRPTGVLLETADGVTLVPAKLFSEETSVLLGEVGS